MERGIGIGLAVSTRRTRSVCRVRVRARVRVCVTERDKGHAWSQVTTSGIYLKPHGARLALGIVSLCRALNAFTARWEKDRGRFSLRTNTNAARFAYAAIGKRIVSKRRPVTFKGSALNRPLCSVRVVRNRVCESFRTILLVQDHETTLQMDCKPFATYFLGILFNRRSDSNFKEERAFARRRTLRSIFRYQRRRLRDRSFVKP